MQKIRCVTYKDKFSAGNSSYKDLMIGHEHGVVGCGSKVFNASKKGDLVIITATRDGYREVEIGILTEKLDSCDKWSCEGGMNWPYNFKYKPLSNLFKVDDNVKDEIKKFCEIHQLKEKNLFHSRFCSNKLKLVVDMLIAKYSI